MRPDQQRQQQQQQQEKERQERERRDGKSENDRVSEGRNPATPKLKDLADLLRSNEQWGLLPKKMADEMRSSPDREFPSEYREAISRYYQKLAELMEKDGGR